MSDSDEDSRRKLTKTHQLIHQLEQKLQSHNETASPSFQIYRPSESRDSQLKSKADLERDLFEFEQRIKKLHVQGGSLQQSAVSDKQESPLKQQVFQMLSAKLENVEQEKVKAADEKVKALKREQQQLELEQLNLMRTNQQCKFELEALLNQLELEEQQRLGENRLKLMQEQETKLHEIQEQSERLLEEEDEKKQTYYQELQELQIEKQALQQELQMAIRDHDLVQNQKEDMAAQLSTLMQLHNQMLQNDLKKKTIQLDSHSQSQLHFEESGNKNNQLDTLYLMNQQMQEQMNQQLSLIRQELNEQKELNIELLKYLNINPREEIIQSEVQPSENLKTEESSMIKQKYPEVTKQEFDELFQKHKKTQFKPKFIGNYLKGTKSFQKRSSQDKQSKSKSKSKSKSPHRQLPKQKSPPKIKDSFQVEQKKRISEQMKRLNQIVEQSLKA